MLTSFSMYNAKSPACNDYTQFRILTAQLPWGNDALRSIFIEGLSDYIIDGMVGREAPTDFDEVVDLA